jgi:hypothetical protein
MKGTLRAVGLNELLVAPAIQIVLYHIRAFILVRLPRYKVCLTTIYSCRLRLQEGTHLQVEDIDRAALSPASVLMDGLGEYHLPLSFTIVVPVFVVPLFRRKITVPRLRPNRAQVKFITLEFLCLVQ